MRWLTVIFLFMAKLSFGQAPGYMGKRLLLAGELSFFTALFNPNHNQNQGLRKFSFNIRSTTDLDYVVARNASVGLTFDVLASGMRYDWNSDQFNDLLIPNVDTRFDHARIYGFGYGLNYKIFRNPSRGGIAPVGSYVKFDLMVLDVRVRPFDKLGSSAHSFSDRFFTPAASITLALQRVLWDFLVIRSGVQLGFVPMGISPYLQSLDKGIGRATQEQDLRAHAEARLVTYYLFNINFGVGFLLPFRKSYRAKG